MRWTATMLLDAGMRIKASDLADAHRYQGERSLFSPFIRYRQIPLTTPPIENHKGPYDSR
jgi:hypothetical protein